jgi:predicted DNA-binding transcriptional regulator AlpA
MTNYLRFNDLVARGVLRNRVTLGRWVKDHGFPPGLKIGDNTRVWTEESIEKWIAERASTTSGHVRGQAGGNSARPVPATAPPLRRNSWAGRRCTRRRPGTAWNGKLSFGRNP